MHAIQSYTDKWLRGKVGVGWSFNQQSRLELYDLKLAIYIYKFIMDKL